MLAATSAEVITGTPSHYWHRLDDGRVQCDAPAAESHMLFLATWEPRFKAIVGTAIGIKPPVEGPTLSATATSASQRFSPPSQLDGHTRCASAKYRFEPFLQMNPH